LVFHQRLEREGWGLEGWVVRTWEVLVVMLGWSGESEIVIVSRKRVYFWERVCFWELSTMMWG
jgi:hypothetical protein